MNKAKKEFGHKSPKKPRQSKKYSVKIKSKNKTITKKGTRKPLEKATPNSIYEQLKPDGSVRCRAFYDEKGRIFNRQDFDHPHYNKKNKRYYQPHEHSFEYNSKGQRIGKTDGPLKKGYNNKPTWRD